MDLDCTKLPTLEDCSSEMNCLSKHITYDNNTVTINKMKEILNKIKRNCVKLGFYHNVRYNRYRYFLFWVFRLPSLVLSGLNGFFAIGVQKYVSQNTISVTNASISFLCGLITSIEISLNLQKRMEIELDTYKKMYKLTVEIDKDVNCIFEINENVKTKLLETVEKKYIEYQSIISTSNIVTSMVVLNEDEFEKIYIGNDVEINRMALTEDQAQQKNKLILDKIVKESQYMFPFLHTSHEEPDDLSPDIQDIQSKNFI